MNLLNRIHVITFLGSNSLYKSDAARLLRDVDLQVSGARRVASDGFVRSLNKFHGIAAANGSALRDNFLFQGDRLLGTDIFPCTKVIKWKKYKQSYLSL